MGSQAVFPVDGPAYGNQRSVAGMVAMYQGADGKAYPMSGDSGAIDAGSSGAIITTGASAANVAIPHLANGDNPTRLRIVATAAAYVRLGTPDEVSAVVATTGTGYAPADEITLAGGVATIPAVLAVETVKLVSLAGNALGSGYNVADTITLAGGLFNSAAIITLATTKLASCALNAPGTGYAPADTITLTGGTHSIAAVLTVATTKVVSATIDDAGTGGTPGAATVTGTTGTGTKFQANVTIDGTGVITAVNSITVAGSYTANPTDIAHEPVTGGGLTGAKLAVVLGVATFTVTTRGSYTVQAATFTQASTSGVGTGATFQTASYGPLTWTYSTPGDYTEIAAALTQGATSGAGTGATFQSAAYGVLTASVADAGDYETFPTNPVAQDSTTGGGTAAAFTMTWGIAAAAGDLLVQPGDGVIVSAIGYEEVSAIRVTADGVVQISPL